MQRHEQQAPDRAKLTMDTAAMAFEAAKSLSNTRIMSVVDAKGATPETGPKEILGSAILFAVAIELALNCLRMEEKMAKENKRKGTKSKSAERHDLSAIYESLTKENRDAIACEVATLGWKISDVLEFHQSMVMDWRYPINRMPANEGLFWWGAEPLVATFEGILGAWKKRYPRTKTKSPIENTEEVKRRMLAKMGEVKNKMNAARVIKNANRT